jgi:hypothetical protein
MIATMPDRHTRTPSSETGSRRAARIVSMLCPLAIALVGIAGMSAIWVLLALAVDRHCAWMAALAGADIALLLRLGNTPSGWPRASLTVVATLIVIACANWGIAAAQVGLGFGFGLVDSLGRLGPHFAWTLAGLVNQPAELFWYGAAILIAWWLGR